MMAELWFEVSLILSYQMLVITPVMRLVLESIFVQSLLIFLMCSQLSMSFAQELCQTENFRTILLMVSLTVFHLITSSVQIMSLSMDLELILVLFLSSQ